MAVDNLQTRYSNLLFYYKGSGTIHFQGTEHDPIACTFEVAQLARGRVVLQCCVTSIKDYQALKRHYKLFTLTGTTINSEKAEIKGFSFPFSSSFDGVKAIVEFSAQQMRVARELGNSAEPETVRYGIANFKFSPLMNHLDLAVQSSQNPVRVELARVPEYKKRVELLDSDHNIQVTCIATLQKGCGVDLQTSGEFVGHLCEVMSVARATRVNWVYRQFYDASNTLLISEHESRVTFPYFTPSPIDDRPDGTSATKTFIETAYRRYTANSEHQQRYKNIINAYVDSRDEDRFIEARAVSMAVVLEVVEKSLQSIYELPRKTEPQNGERFRQIADDLREEIHSVAQNREDSDRIRGAIINLGQPRKKTFRELLQGIFSAINLSVISDDITQFIASRNALVHEGQFYCESVRDTPNPNPVPLPSITHEYLFLLNFLDRVVLKAFGYSGQYVNYRTFETDSLT